MDASQKEKMRLRRKMALVIGPMKIDNDMSANDHKQICRHYEVGGAMIEVWERQITQAMDAKFAAEEQRDRYFERAILAEERLANEQKSKRTD